MTLSLRDALLKADDERSREAAAEATYWNARRGERLLRTRLEGKLNQAVTRHPTPIWQPRRGVTATSSGGIETKERHEPIAIPHSRWVRQNDDHWVRVQ